MKPSTYDFSHKSVDNTLCGISQYQHLLLHNCPKYWTPYLWACNITPFTLMPIRRSVLNDFPGVQSWTYFPDIPVLLRILRATYNLYNAYVCHNISKFIALNGNQPISWTFILVNIILQNFRDITKTILVSR